MRPNLPIASPSDTIREAADRMSRAATSAIPVLLDGKLVGVLCDCDITKNLAAKGLDAASATVGELMDANPVRISDDRDFESAALVMQARHTRALVVQDLFGRFIGILTDRELCGSLHFRTLETKK